MGENINRCPRRRCRGDFHCRRLSLRFRFSAGVAAPGVPRPRARGLSRDLDGEGRRREARQSSGPTGVEEGVGQSELRWVEAGFPSFLPHDSHRNRPVMLLYQVLRCALICRMLLRNGTPRQPLLVPLARASLVFDPSRIPLEALEGLADYTHCWILYVFHLNTDLEKLWKPPSQSKFKAKVRVPRLKGGKMGVLATRSPHRPCPIGLTVAKVEALDGHAILLSGVDLVDGTPVLDIKPYLPYSDSIQAATVPKWLEQVDDTLVVASVSFSADFAASLSGCWATAEKQSLYCSAKEFQSLIKEVLSWDIRSPSQRSRPRCVALENERHGGVDLAEESHNDDGNDSDQVSNAKTSASSASDVIYHLILEGVDVSYTINGSSNIIVERATLADTKRTDITSCNYLVWREKFQHKK